MDAERQFDIATERLHRAAGSGSQQVSTKRGVESTYSEAYQRLVREGRRPQIRQKYR